MAELDIQPLLDANYGTAMVINPTGDKYTEADFEVFEKLFNMFRGPGNLKVVGLGGGVTFVNQVIAPRAGNQIADILTVGGHSGGPFKGYTPFEPLWAEATQKRGAVEIPYCSVLGTADQVVPYI